MKQYTIKKAVEEINARNIGALTRYYLYYELKRRANMVDFDFCDEFIQVIYNCYIDNKNYLDICAYCKAVANYFELNEIDTASVNTVKELTAILQDIY